MSIEVERGTLACSVCGAHVTELRRGRCWGCYMKWAELRPVGKGATCAVCFERRRDFLRLVELHNRSLPLCHGCAARASKLVPAPYSVEGLRAALRRDRRVGDRRDGMLDQRIFPRERRTDDRRGDRRALAHADTDPSVMLSGAIEDVIELVDADIDVLDQTSVRPLPPHPVAKE